MPTRRNDPPYTMSITSLATMTFILSTDRTLHPFGNVEGRLQITRGGGGEGPRSNAREGRSEQYGERERARRRGGSEHGTCNR